MKDKSPVFLPLADRSVPECFAGLPTPSFVIDERQLRVNGEILKGVQDRTGCKILLAQKAFSNFDFYPLLENYLAGTEASGLFETKLGRQYMPDREVHVFCAAYREDQIDEIISLADHIVFNSPSQLKRFGPRAKAAGKSLGLRINPECSTQQGHEIYDPCYPGGRLGTTREHWDRMMTEEDISLLDGIHFHTLCQQNSDDLETTLMAVDQRFGDILSRMKWINFGGGHHIVRHNYDIPRLERCIRFMQEKYGLTVYLEPGEGVVLNAGYMVTSVLDLFTGGGINHAILDFSAACHNPDVLEMPFRPPLYGSGEAGEKAYTYRMGAPTCLSGDSIDDYSFDEPLELGDVLVFGDAALYSTCKTNTFNGMPLPDIFRMKEDGSFERLTSFGYEDFRYRLGRK